MFLPSSLALTVNILLLFNSVMGQQNMTRFEMKQEDVSLSERNGPQHHNLVVLPYGSLMTKNDTRSSNRSLFLRKRHLSSSKDLTLDYGPGGWCVLCGRVDDYSCDRGIHEVNWNAGVRTFQDPTLCGAMFVKATVYGGDLGAVSLRVFLNDVLIGEQMWQGSPFCDTCTSAVFESAISSYNGSYVVGGENKIQLVPVGDDDPNLLPAICVQRVELDLMGYMSCIPSTSPSEVPTLEPSLEPTLYPSSSPSTLAGRPLKITLANPTLLDPTTLLSYQLCLTTNKIQRNQDIVLGHCCTELDANRINHLTDPVCDVKHLHRQIWFFDEYNQLRLDAYPEYCIHIENGHKLKLDNECDGKEDAIIKEEERVHSSVSYSKSSKSRKRSTSAKFLVEDSLSNDTLWVVESDLGSTSRMFVGLKKPKSTKASSSRSRSKGKSSKSEKCKTKQKNSSRLLKSSKSCKSTIKQRNSFKLYVYGDSGVKDDTMVGKGLWSFEFQSSIPE